MAPDDWSCAETVTSCFKTWRKIIRYFLSALASSLHCIARYPNSQLQTSWSTTKCISPTPKVELISTHSKTQPTETTHSQCSGHLFCPSYPQPLPLSLTFAPKRACFLKNKVLKTFFFQFFPSSIANTIWKHLSPSLPTQRNRRPCVAELTW